MAILWSKVSSSCDILSSQRLLVLIIFKADVFHIPHSAVDTRILTGRFSLQSIFNVEEMRMNSDDDTFFEDDEYEEEEDDFPGKEETEDEDDGYDPIDAIYEPGGQRLANFVKAPWPPTTFILVIIGLAMVLLTPPDLWALYNYFLIADYFMIILGGAAITFSLITWNRAGKHRLRWAGVTNLFLVTALIVVATLDTFSWVVSAQSIIPGVDTPIISLALVLVVFSIYSLWVIQRNFGGPNR